MDHHLPHRPLALFALLVIGGSVGCDGGKKSYESCLSYEREQNFELATGFCKQAASEAPNSPSGKLAAERLVLMQTEQGDFEKAKNERAAADTKEREARLAALSAKVSTSSIYSQECTSHGYPPRGLEFTGATYKENEEVATARGCVHMSPVSEGNASFNWYCCPPKS